EKWKQTLAYRMLHKVLPELYNGRIDELGDLIYDYRFNMGSIDNCSFCYPRMVEIGNSLRFLKEERKVEVLSLSSVGPAFFAIGSDLSEATSAFMEAGMHIYQADLYNSTYTAEFIND